MSTVGAKDKNLLSVPVPPTFVAFDKDNQSCSSLCEWFLKSDDYEKHNAV